MLPATTSTSWSSRDSCSPLIVPVSAGSRKPRLVKGWLRGNGRGAEPMLDGDREVGGPLRWRRRCGLSPAAAGQQRGRGQPADQELSSRGVVVDPGGAIEQAAVVVIRLSLIARRGRR